MSDYIGTREQVDEYVGSRLVEAAYLGSRKYYDAYSEVSGSLPLVYESRVAHILKNYRLYGTSEGAGVETENLFDKDDKGAGYYNGYYLTNNAQHMSPNSNWAISAYIPVTQGVTYVVWWSMYETVSAAAPSIEFYTARQASTRIGLTRYEDRGRFLITAPSGAEYARISFYKANEDFTTFAPSDTMITEPIPRGYKLPLTVTSGAQSQNYPLYIGDSKLGAEEYVDYAEQKVWKFGANVYDKDDSSMHYGPGYALNTDTYRWVAYTGTGHSWRVPCMPNTKYRIRVPNAVPIFKVATVRTASITTSSNPVNTYGLFVASVETSEYVYTTDSSALYIVMQFSASEASTITESLVVQALQPTDPPVPLPAIIAYKGENVLSSTETLGPVTVKGRISTPST